MLRYLSTWLPMLVACSAYAQDGMGGPPSETVSVFWVALFIILFLGMIVGFFVYLWWKERKGNAGDQQ